MPLIRPALASVAIGPGSSVRPCGSRPEVTAYVTLPVPPCAEMVLCEGLAIGTPTVAATVFGELGTLLIVPLDGPVT